MAIGMKRIPLFALLAMFLAANALAHKPPEPAHLELSIPLSQKVAPAGPLDPTLNGWINRTSGVLAALMNQNEGPFNGGPEPAARAYLAERSAEFGLTNAGADLLLDHVATSPAGKHVRFHQAIGGVRIWKSEVVVSLDESASRVRAVHSSYDPIAAHSAVSATPSIGSAAALEIALAALRIEGEPNWIGPPTQKLWMVREQDRVGSFPHLAWRVVIPIQNPIGDWELFVDATTGEVLRIGDQMVYTDGSGYIFDPDPLTTAQVDYGGAYVDDDDSDNTPLNAERFVRTLRDLTYEGGAYHLSGPYVALGDFEDPAGDPVTEIDPNGFTYTRSQQGFEDVMCYYFIDMSQRYIQSLGFDDIQNGPLNCDSHGMNGADNSHYVPSQNLVAFGEGGVDDAEDADVILHEYGHAIQYDIVSNWGGGHQPAMGEGFGDYWAGSYSTDVSDYNWEWVFNWDGHNPFWYGRILNSSKHYPEDLVGQVHADGEIWSAPWMQIYFDCGRTVTDTNMLLHHYYQGGSATMAEAAAFAMQADLDLYDGLHSGTMNNYFVSRGFFSEGQYDIPTLYHIPLGDQSIGGPYLIWVNVQSDSDIVPGSVLARYGYDGVFDRTVRMQPTGNPNEWAGQLPDGGGEIDIRYYIEAANQAGWKGAHPPGAEFQYHEYHVGPITAVETLGGSTTLALMPASPNPSSPETTLRFTLPNETDVELAIHDLSGRKVRTIADGMLAAGTHAYRWTGEDDTDRALPNGLYFVSLFAEGRKLSRKVVIAK